MNSNEKAKHKSMWFRMMEAKRMFAHLPFLTIAVVVGLVYISNVHIGESKVRKVNEMKKEVQKLRWQYVSLHSRMMQNTTQSHTADKVGEKGLKWGANRPIVIIEKK